MHIFSSLFAKLALALLLLTGLLSAALFSIWQNTSQAYSHEIMQRLNASIAMYVTDAHQLIRQGEVDHNALQTLAERAMIINPSVEIYLLDTNGNIISNLIPKQQLHQTQIDLSAIEHFLSETPTLPIYAQDPKHPTNQKVFSVSPVMDNQHVAGYLYAIIGGRMYDTIAERLQSSYTLKSGLFAFGLSLLAAMILAGLVFYWLTHKLRSLTQEVQRFHLDNFQVSHSASRQRFADAMQQSYGSTELNQLSQSFYAMAQHIQSQFEQLGQADKTRRELIANISHDLRTPLAALQGNLETVQIKAARGEAVDQNTHITIALKQSQHLATLINQLFELSKLDAGIIDPSLETFSLSELIYDTLHEHQLAAQTKSLHFDFDIQAPFPVHADIALIHRVIQNLIDNAIKHSPEHGTVTITLTNDNNKTRLSIKDQGSGICKNDLPFIFERFYQSSTPVKTAQQGTGLGLAIVKRILDLHHSTISVSSEVNYGTTFCFDLQSKATTAG